jgi:hypothetical protein
MKRFLLSLLLVLSLYGQAWAPPPLPPEIYKDTDCNQAKYQRFGILCHDTDDGKMYKWNGTSVVEVSLGGSVIVTDAATGNVLETDLRGQTHKVTGAYTLSLATAAIGANACFFASTAAVFSLDLTTGTDVFILNGSSLTAGFKVTSDGTLGAKICVEATEAGFYRATPIVGVFGDGGA